MPNNNELSQDSDDEQESEITFIHTLPSEVLVELIEKQLDSNDSYCQNIQLAL